MENRNCVGKYETPQNLIFTKLDLHDLDYMEICEKQQQQEKSCNQGYQYFENVLNNSTKECNKQGLYIIHTLKSHSAEWISDRKSGAANKKSSPKAL